MTLAQLHAQLTELLKDTPGNAVVHTGGCDCIGEASYVSVEEEHDGAGNCEVRVIVHRRDGY